MCEIVSIPILVSFRASCTEWKIANWGNLGIVWTVRIAETASGHNDEQSVHMEKSVGGSVARGNIEN